VWFAYGIANALRENRSASAAQSFLTHQPSAPELQLLAAEMLIADGKSSDGIERLPALAAVNSPVGYRASCLLALVNLDLKRYDAARGWVLHNPQLAADLTGRELLAQIALRGGQTADTENIYRSILTDSTEAKVYFSKKAFEQHDWKQARTLTTELIRGQPDNLQFRANLLAIDRAEAGK
jgi:predicted Zn-dependent protease